MTKSLFANGLPVYLHPFGYYQSSDSFTKIYISIAITEPSFGSVFHISSQLHDKGKMNPKATSMT